MSFVASPFVLGPEIARGSMGTVYRAIDSQTSEVVALKVLHAEFANDVQVKARFLSDAAILSSLDHPSVARLRQITQLPDGNLALVMELIEGPNLREYLGHRGTLSSSSARAIVVQLLEGLQAAHDLGVVHRDVKPENILIRDEAGVPVVKLIDFGVARLATGPTMTNASSQGSVGTTAYMAPEMFHVGNDVTAAADVYAAGLVLYELVAGRLPARGAADPFAQVPDELRLPLQAMLAEEPDERPPSAAAAAAVLLAVGTGASSFPHAAGAASSPGRTSMPRRGARQVSTDDPADPGLTSGLRRSRQRVAPTATAERAPRRWPWVVGTVVTLLLVAGGATYAFTRPDPKPVVPISVTEPPTTEAPTTEAPTTQPPPTEPPTTQPPATQPAPVVRGGGRTTPAPAPKPVTPRPVTPQPVQPKPSGGGGCNPVANPGAC